MSDKLHEYRGTDVDVTYDASRCIHFAACVRSLPRVFDPGSRPWVMPDNGAPEAVVRAVESCPTGALQYVRKEGAGGEQPAPVNTATVSRNGPTYLRGTIEVHAGGPVRPETRMALCRCGASSHKPYCDGTHARVRFRDPGQVVPPPILACSEEPEGRLHVEPVPDGPVVILGRVRMVDASGATVGVVKDPSLCMCGKSGNKPFCDGTHLWGEG